MIRIDDSALVNEMRVIREELRIIKTMLAERMPMVVASPDRLPERVLTTKQVLAMLPFGYGRLRNLRSAGLFPRAVKMGVKREGYLEKEVVAWIATQQNRDANRAVR